MEVLAGLAAWALASLSSSVPGGAHLSSASGGIATTVSHITSMLSPNATIHFRGSEAFQKSTVRWSAYERPEFLIAIEVATESDVQQAVRKFCQVKLANALHLPFLATSGGHGGVASLGQMDNGVQINLRKLNFVEIQEDGKSAVMGGGILTKEVTDALWPQGKQAVTGLCECTSLLGPSLGGGHGWLQGRYGLGVDNIIEANVVLANGSLVTASSDSHADLFWGLRGAGHNFGIVTSVRYKIYDVPDGNVWTLGTYVFTQDRLEPLFELLNELGAGGKQPVELLTWAYFLSLPDVDPNHAAISAYLIYEGTMEDAAPYDARFRALKPVTATTVPAQFPELPKLTYQSLDAIASTHRAAFDLFNDAMQKHPGLSNSFFISEGYTLRAVQEVPAESTAYPDRFNNILLSPIMIYSDSSLDAEVLKIGTAIRELLVEGTESKKLHAYVNYATGDESLEALYGYEEWRIRKLRSLKAEYDPANKFRFHGPIV